MSQAVCATPASLNDRIEATIKTIPDFPKEGILFRDYTPVLRDPKLFHDVIARFADLLGSQSVDYVVGIESRGFTLGAVLAQHLGVGFIPVRKKGKLPGDVVAHHYDLEYGSDCIEMQADSFLPGARVIMIDDLLATGGTMAASAELVRKLGGDIRGMFFLIELLDLQGRQKLPTDLFVEALVKY